MKISIGFSGAAGSGVNTSGMLLGQLLSSKGYSVFGDKEYASIIKGDNNNFFLYISDDHPFIAKTIDHFFPFDEYSITKNAKIYTLKKTHPLKDTTIKYKNVFFFGAALKLLGIAREEGEKLLASQFVGDVLAVNIDCLTKGYAYFKVPKYDLSKNIGSAKEFLFGNELIGTGAIASGMNFYSAYPMTPASSLIEVVQSHKEVTFLQCEDEVAVSMVMLGAKFAGKRSMCGTSGGGFALMTESISFSHQAELGGVYILSQRDGPSTGTPTYTGQGDLNYALNASFGETYPIVLAPSTFEEGYNLIGKALNRSDIYQHPVIFLVDKQLSEGYISVDKSKLVSQQILRGKINTVGIEGYKRYETTSDGISPSMLPGVENGEFIATSYEHDEYGTTNEDPIIKKQQLEKRFKKMETFIQQEFTKDFYGYEIINPEAKEFFVTFGVNRYVIEEFIRIKNSKFKIQNGSVKFGLIIIKCLQPFDMRLKEFLDINVKKIKKLIFVEMNYSGQLQELLTHKCRLNDKKWNNKIKNIRKYSLYPVFAEDIKNGMNS
ncbi:MAG: hypothetical protein NTY80_00865 [candidate division SR1 bacterium]|nr:hypothetical protein [candidate division SR1 bacterium]